MYCIDHQKVARTLNLLFELLALLALRLPIFGEDLTEVSFPSMSMEGVDEGTTDRVVGH